MKPNTKLKTENTDGGGLCPKHPSSEGMLPARGRRLFYMETCGGIGRRMITLFQPTNKVIWHTR